MTDRETEELQLILEQGGQRTDPHTVKNPHVTLQLALCICRFSQLQIV